MDKRFLYLLLILFFQPAAAQVQLNDSARITLLTASPWYEAVYAYFGHTAIRVQDDSTGVDAVFNYGYFDSSQPNFMYHFIRGETDYVLGVITYEQFMAEYGYKGQEVVEQELNLLVDEKRNLYEALMINSLPENRGYRYNYFYDNCATRPRDMVERYTQAGVLLPEAAILSTGRISSDMVVKAIYARVPVLASLSIPTDLALQFAQEYGITLIGRAMKEDYTVYSHRERIR